MKVLKSLNTWAYCVSGKRPAIGLSCSSEPISYDKAKEIAEKTDQHYGLIFKEDSEYIGFDIDVDPDGSKTNSTTSIPPAVLFFLKCHPTHAHYSPSGLGLHLVYKLTPEAREKLEKYGCKQGAASISKDDLYNGDWRYKKCFLVFTENLHPLSADTIAELSIEDILDIVPSIKPEKPVELPAVPGKELAAITQVPPLSFIEKCLENIPAAFNNAAEKACNKLSWFKPKSDYDYWLLVGCACSHHAILLNRCGRTEDSKKVFNLFLEWSKRDTTGFVSEEDVRSKYEALLRSTEEKLAKGEHVTTYGTLALIAKETIIEFPDMIVNKKGGVRPDPGSIRNLQFLFEYDGLEMVFDPMGGGLCIKGPEKTILEWFCPKTDYLAMRPTGYSQVASIVDMSVRMRGYMQDRYKYSVSSGQARDAVDFFCQNMKTENAFKAWIESAPWDGVKRFESVCNSITVPELELEHNEVYVSYIRKSLLSMIGIHFWPEDSPKISAMIVLIGPEYTYKSSWAEWLIPKHMGNYIATADVETAIAAGKEWMMFLSTKAVVVINECEPMFSPRYEQKIKSSVDSESVTYRDPYARQVLSRPRTALIIGTTNKTNLFTGSTGTRKIWQIPVKECDSMLIKNMDLQQLYAEIYDILKRFKERNPDALIQSAWEQTPADRDKTNRLNARRKSQDLGVLGLLIERFGHFLEREFNPKDFVGTRGVALRTGKPGSLDNTPNAWTVSCMLKFLKYEFPEDKVDRSGVKYALEEYAANFTGSIHHPIKPFDDFVLTERGRKSVIRGRIEMGPSNYYYLMPTPLNIYDDSGEVIE